MHSVLKQVRTLFISVLALTFATSALGVDAITHVEQRGTGAIPMVLIPGSPSDWRVWDTFMDRNSDRYTMYALTLAGFSGTEPLPEPDGSSPTQWMDAGVEAITHFIEERKLKDVVVVGHSLGGHLALRLAIEHPDAAAKIIDVDGVPVANLGQGLAPEERAAFVSIAIEPQLKQLSEQQATAMLEGSAHAMVTDPSRGDELAAMFNLTDYKVAIEYLLEGVRSDVSGQLKEITTPTLIIAAIGQAGADQAPRDELRALWEQWTTDADAIEVVQFDDSMHFVMDDQPKKLDKAIAAFLDVK
jgi:pimeloyl-ACP methyl ester carboxylesterase